MPEGCKISLNLGVDACCSKVIRKFANDMKNKKTNGRKERL